MGYHPQGFPIGKALAEYLDIHSVVDWNKQNMFGVNDFWDARLAVGFVQTPIKPLLYWSFPQNISLDGILRSPAGYDHIALESKACFDYPHVAIDTRLPVLVDGQAIHWGVENGSFGNGGAVFRWRRTAGVNFLEVAAAADYFAGMAYQDITAALPANATTAKNQYDVIVHKRWAEFYVNQVLVAVGINSHELAFTAVAYPRIRLFPANMAFTDKMLALIESDGAGAQLDFPIHPAGYTVSSGDPYPPRVFRLYLNGTNTLMAGQSADSFTSHPFPIYGCKNKTIHFQADEAGTLDIQLLMETNNWRTYDTVAIAANTLESFTIAGEGVLARILFTPTAPPATVTEAECVIR